MRDTDPRREPIVEKQTPQRRFVVRSADGDFITCRSLGEARAMAGLIRDNGARDVTVGGRRFA